MNNGSGGGNGQGRSSSYEQFAAREGIEIEDPIQDVEEPMGENGGPDEKTEEAPPPPLAEEPWPELHEDALYGVAGDYVREIEPHTESDRAALLVQTLAYAGNVIGRFPYYATEDDFQRCNINGVMVGPSATGRKGTSAGRVLAFFMRSAPEWVEKCMLNSLSSGEGLIHRVRDPVYKIKKGKLEMTDAGVDDHRLMVTVGEFFQILAVMVRPGNTLSVVIREAWDGKKLEIPTRTAPETSTDAHISIIGQSTKEELLQHLDSTSLMNGFANRFLFVLVKRSQYLAHGGGDLDDAVKTVLGKRLKKAIEAAQSGSTIMAPWQVTMTEAAKVEWDVIYNKIEREVVPGMLGGVCRRRSPQTLRLAMIYALLDCAKQIDVVHLRAALALWRYCEASAKFIFGDLLGDVVADSILLALRQQGDGGLSRNDIYEMACP
jgi:hypothetical protein